MDTLRPRNTQGSSITFCGCILDFETQTLQSKNQVIRLRSKLWQVFTHLINHSNKLVLRDLLIENIWHGNRYTGEQGLTHAICHLRRIIKQLDLDVKIMTIPKKGYILKYDSGHNHKIDFTHSFKSSSETNNVNEKQSPLISSTLDFIYNP